MFFSALNINRSLENNILEQPSNQAAQPVFSSQSSSFENSGQLRNTQQMDWMGQSRSDYALDNVEPSSFNRKSGLIMQICTQTWFADSHGLFDYENRTTVSHEFKCTCKFNSYQINRCGTEIKFLTTEEAKLVPENDSTDQPIAQIVWGDGHYYLLPPPSKLKQEPLWLVVRNFRCRPVVVSTGDVLKFGRFKLKIKKVVTTQQEATQKRLICCSDDECETVAPDPADVIDMESSNISGSEPVLKLESEIKTNLDRQRTTTTLSTNSHTLVSHSLQDVSGNRICRICLCETEEISTAKIEDYNPLIAPCECNGSMKWVHLQCLRIWISGRLNIKSDSVAFFWKLLSCELCKLTYPTMIEAPVSLDSENPDSANKQRIVTLIELFEIPKPLVPYIILELKNQQNKGYYIVSLANSKIAKLGRGHESDIRLADISVSRLHSILRFESAANLSRQAHSIIGSNGFGAYNNKKAETGQFIIEDNRSKFGTLIELKQPIKLEMNHLPLSIQVGRTVITISIKRRWRLRFPTCIGHNASDIYFVLRQSNNRISQPNDTSEQNRSDQNAQEEVPPDENPNTQLIERSNFQPRMLFPLSPQRRTHLPVMQCPQINAGDLQMPDMYNAQGDYNFSQEIQN